MIEPVIMGALAGFLIATSGAIKDRLWEPFEWAKYARSIYLGAIGGLLASQWYPAGDPLVWFSVSLAFERIVLEVWKAFLRQPSKRPDKFNSPTRDARWVYRYFRKKRR